jgi:hypothetical protein
MSKQEPPRRKLSHKEMIDRVNEIRLEKGIPIDAADRYQHQIKHHLTPVQERAVRYLSSKGKDTSFITDPENNNHDHQTDIHKRFEQFLEKRVSKPNQVYSESEYDIGTKKRTSPRNKSPSRHPSPSKEEKPPLHPRNKSPVRSQSPHTQSRHPRKRKQPNEDKISFSLFDSFGNERRLSLDLTEKSDCDKTFFQLLEEQCIRLEGQQIVVDGIPCRPDNMVSICVQSDSQISLEYRMIKVSYQNEEFDLPSYLKFEDIKRIIGVSPTMRLFVDKKGIYLPPSSHLANFALDDLNIRSERPMSIQFYKTPIEIGPLETVEVLYEKLFRNAQTQNLSTGYLFVRRNEENCLIQPFGSTIEDILRPNDDVFIKDINISINYSIDHLDSSGTIDMNSSSSVKEILQKLKLDHRSFDIIRTLDNQILKPTDIIACCLMPGYSIKITRKKPLLQSLSQSFHYYIQKGREMKTSQLFSKNSKVYDLVQYLNKEHLLSLTQQWMVCFKNDQMFVPLLFFPEESNLPLTIPSGSTILPLNLYENTLSIRISLNGHIFDKTFNPFLTLKENLQKCGFFPDPLQYDCFIQSPSSGGQSKIIDTERDMIDVEQNSLLFFMRRSDRSNDSSEEDE